MELWELPVKDELNIYLVANALRPASLIDIHPTRNPFRKRATKSEDHIGSTHYTTFGLAPEDLQSFRAKLDQLGIVYESVKRQEIHTFKDPQGGYERIIKVLDEFKIASDRENLETLLSAQGSQQFGRALGFPEEAVMAFKRVIDGELRNWSYVMVCLAKAKNAGMALPTWLAYLSFTPEQLDLVGGKVSASSEVLGKHYQDFVRNHHPELAERVEKTFLEINLPNSWELMRGGGYSLTFPS